MRLSCDDTLIIDGAVHLPAIRFVYQCKNKGVAVILITHHELYYSDTIWQSLESYAIHKALFTEIISLGAGDEKRDFISPDGAIFIDNAYAERSKVQKRHNIPVFDVDGIEILLDWRL